MVSWSRVKVLAVNGQPKRASPLPWFGVAAALAVTVIVVAIIIRSAPVGPPQEASGTRDQLQDAAPAVPGVRAILTAAGVTVQRRLPAMAFALGDGQTLDAQLPPGPFDGEFIVTFHPGAVRRAALGAAIQGGSLMIQRKGKVLASDYASDKPRVLMTDTVFLPSRLVTFTYRFRRDGGGPTRLRALWQPQDSAVAVALPSGGGGLLADDAVAGFALVQQLNCVACHISKDPDLQAELDINAAPILGQIGARARPDWIRNWIAQPQSLKGGAFMPALFHPAELEPSRLDDLTHFLVSMGGPIDETKGEPNHDLVDTGMVLYHSVGCFACHGPREPIENLPGFRPPGPEPGRSYTPLGPLAFKTTPGRLAAFLGDPLAIRPSGRMPSQNLTEIEAEAIASYLIHRDGRNTPTVEQQPFVLDRPRIERGAAIFVDKGCANCHRLGPGRPTIISSLRAPSLERVSASVSGPMDVPGGCLAEAPPPGSADFGITARQRTAIVAFLRTMPMRRGWDVPHDRLAATMDRLNCLACHQFHGAGGPERAVAPYFTTLGDFDLGDEGRLPPDLGDEGARLNPQWLANVLSEHGIARPYMAARMPQFGEANVRRLPELFAAVAGVPAEPDQGPDFSEPDAEIGRQLVGAGGFNCIQCHSIAARASTDLPGSDLAQMVERLRYSYFATWMHDPKLLRAGTRMPSFFSAGRSGLTEHLGGDADRQIAAMWAYLSQGELLPLPDGLIDPGSDELQAGDEPIVLGTLMKDVGARSIACGFPPQ